MGVRWTDDQLRVIESRNRNLLVSAAAGSGKTAVLVERIIRMITDEKEPLDIDQLLVVTFTNAAAAEMRERIGQAVEKLLEDRPEDEHLQRQSTLVHHAKITTIHSFCLDLIRSHFNQLELDPDFRIGDEGELLLMQQDVMDQLLEDCYEKGDREFEDFVDTYASGKADHGIADYIWQVYNFSMSNPWPGQWIGQCREELSDCSLEGMKDTAWMHYLMRDVKIQLEELAEQIQEAIVISSEEDGPGVYLPALTHDKQMLEELAAAEDYEMLNESLKSVKFDRLTAVRGKDVDPEKKAAASQIRDRMKKAVTKLTGLYCFENAEEIENDIAGSAGPVRTLLSLTEEYADRYQAKKREKNILDFNDLEHFALKILVEKVDGEIVPTEAAVRLSRQYEEILMDEYQDSNYVQETLRDSISRRRQGHPNVFMVGDVKQSIYRFRLARPELFMEKYETYSREDSDYQKIELHENFRSRATVLQSINDVFYRIMGKSLGNIDYTDETALHPGGKFAETDRKAGTSTELLMVDTGSGVLAQRDEENADYTSREFEARLIAGEIKKLIDPEEGLWVWDKRKEEYRPAEYGDMVILLRSVSGWSETFVNILMNEGIPAYAETKTGYFNTVEVETVLSMLAVTDNPMQDIPLAAVLKSPICGVTDEELAWLMADFKRQTMKGRDRGLYGACVRLIGEEDEPEVVQAAGLEITPPGAVPAARQLSADRKAKAVPPGLEEKLRGFWELLDEMTVKARYLSIHELLYEVYRETGYYDYVSAMPAGDTRRANLDMLVEKAIAYESTSYHGLFHFIRYIDRLKKYDTDFGEAQAAGEQEQMVRIMSIHKSKGLEFPIVFLAAMGKQFNRQDAYKKILIDPDLGIGADYLDLENRLKTTTLKKNVLKRRMDLENMGEELRVLYVAMTRAKEKLIMTGTDRSLEKKLEKWRAVPSRGRLPFTILSTASSYLDWVLMSMADPSCRIEAREIPIMDIVSGEVEKQAVSRAGREVLLGMDLDTVYDEEYRKALEQALTYGYPWQADTNLHTKMSVSELKKIGQNIDEEETDFLPTIPGFMREMMEEGDQEESTAWRPVKTGGGAYRGTAYHRAMELLQLSACGSRADVEQRLKALVDGKRLTESYYRLLDAGRIWGFVRSGLGKRMAEAEKAGLLHREQQFVMGIPAREMEAADSDELVLIQGIIDAWFEEDGELVLVDYKTDHVGADGEAVLKERYQLQLDYYQKALEQMTGRRVKEKLIYSLTMQKEILLN